MEPALICSISQPARPLPNQTQPNPFARQETFRGKWEWLFADELNDLRREPLGCFLVRRIACLRTFDWELSFLRLTHKSSLWVIGSAYCMAERKAVDPNSKSRVGPK
jgi:hypothetical protein